MKINYSQEKNILLQKTRNLNFEIAKEKIEKNEIIAKIENKNYDNQQIYILNFNDYPVCCPFVENEDEIFLKTLYFDRKYKNLLKREWLE